MQLVWIVFSFLYRALVGVLGDEEAFSFSHEPTGSQTVIYYRLNINATIYGLQYLLRRFGDDSNIAVVPFVSGVLCRDINYRPAPL